MKRADLVLSVDVEGELAAVRSTEIGVPPVAEVDFKIAFLAPEGQAVKKGDSVLRLDTEMLERQLAEKRAELEEAQKKVEQKEIDLGMKLLDLEQQAAQARADLGRAQLKADVPAEVQQRLELEKALLDKQRPRARPAEPRRRGPGHAGAHRGRARVARGSSATARRGAWRRSRSRSTR